MTDMRATERLLEYVSEQAPAAYSELPGDSDAQHQVDDVMNAIAELRRRGDTLVRADDLRLITAAARHGKTYGPMGDTDYTASDQALERIENAVGGRL